MDPECGAEPAECFPVGGKPTFGGVQTATGPEFASSAGFVFGPNCEGCILAPGAYLFARLTIDTASQDANTGAGDLILAGSEWVQSPFCGGLMGNNGDALVTQTGLEPIPEPTVVSLIVFGLAGLVAMRRQKHRCRRPTACP